MLSALIFIAHGLAAIYAFQKYRKEGLGDAFLAVGFMGIIFAVGWTLATTITNLLFMPEWFVKWYYQPLDSYFWYIVRKELSRDTISLVILTLGESAFYYVYLKGTREPEGPGAAPGAGSPPSGA